MSGKSLRHGTFRLGSMYDKGLGFPEDPRKAFELYKQSLQPHGPLEEQGRLLEIRKLQIDG